MEYTPVNIALKGEKQGAYFTPTLGAYDYWAIEYAYKPFSAEQENAGAGENRRARERAATRVRDRRRYRRCDRPDGQSE